jgi:hypothetical protein
VDGIGAGRHASPLLDVESGFATGAAGGAAAGGAAGAAGGVGGAAVAAAGVDPAVVAGVPVVESLEEPLDPQPLSAATRNRSTTLLNAPSAFELIPIATCSYIDDSHRNMSSVDLSSQRRPLAVSGNPAICHSQTGSFASPACAGFALERPAVKHASGGRAPCRTSQTYARNSGRKIVTQRPRIPLAKGRFCASDLQVRRRKNQRISLFAKFARRCSATEREFTRKKNFESSIHCGARLATRKALGGSSCR